MEPFCKILLDWYALEGRDLPWRRTRDAYRIWLSEIILQQTRVVQGMEYYHRFTQLFPDVGALAAASGDEVMKAWQGLGYYSRARNLHAAAKQIVGQFGGRFPQTYGEVRALPGVGDYTAAAICSAAYGLPCAAVDGNVYRVLARFFDLDAPIDTAAGKRAFASLAQSQMDAARPGAFNQAVMDFGATVCTPARPRCDTCPLAGGCQALGAGTVAARPVKRGKVHVRDRWFHYLHIVCGERAVLPKRGAGDIWQGLYQFPLVETDSPADLAAVSRTEAFREWVGPTWTLRRSVALPRHLLTHQRLHATVFRIDVPCLTERSAACAVDAASLGEHAVPRLLERYLEKER